MRVASVLDWGLTSWSKQVTLTLISYQRGTPVEKFPIIDTHVHLWNPKQLRYPWLDKVPALNRPYLLKDYISASGELAIKSMVFMECDVHMDDGLKEAEWITELAKTEPKIKGIVAYAPLERGEQAEPFIEKLANNPFVKGLRRLIQYESTDFCIEPEFVSGVRMLSRYGLSFDICIFHPQLSNTIRLVEQCPDVQFVLDHIGKPDIKNQLFDPWKQEIKRLATLPNVCCKISGMVTEADFKTWMPTDLQPYIEHVITCFGFDRVMYGSDWPVATQASSYLLWFRTLKNAVSGCSAEEQQKLFQSNGSRFYRLNS